MAQVRIRRLRTRYHLAASQDEDRTRLDLILRGVLDETLEHALDRAGVSPHEEICIRALHVPVRLRLSSADSSLLLAWSLALSKSIVRARDGGYVANVVRYHSTAHALFDAAVGVATDRFDRAWAWRLAGAWQGSDAPTTVDAAAALVATWVGQPSFIAPLLAALAAPRLPAHVFEGLLRRLTIDQWAAVTRAALHAAGASPAVIEDAVAPGIAEGVRQAQRMWTQSALARAVASSRHPRLVTGTIEMRRAFAALIALEQDPAALRAPVRARALVSALSDLMHPAVFSAAVPPPPDRSEETVQPRSFGHAGPRNAADPTGPRAPDRQAVVSGRDDVPEAATRRARTRFGGLLFLLKVLDDLGLADDMARRCPHRPFRWLLHQLAMTLVPLEAEDPAALAFAGLLPGAIPPSRDEASPTVAERELCAAMAARIEAALGEAIDEAQPIAFVCDRAAEIVADPGWLAVKFSIADVSTTIRRAGLDLDPGFVPWLGLVVRFVYE